MRALVLSLALASLLPLTASADNTSARRYAFSEALSVQNTRLGEVLMVRSVDIKSDKRLNAGSAIGAAVGYGAAREIKGDYRSAATPNEQVMVGLDGALYLEHPEPRMVVELWGVCKAVLPSPLPGVDEVRQLVCN
jgi:outer membrane lipoprotein SlyB